MSKTKAIALIIAGFGLFLLIKTLFFSTEPWEQHNEAGLKAYAIGNYSEGEKHFVAAVREAEKFPPGDHRLQYSLSHLVEVYRVQGKYSEARPIIQRVLAIDEKILGPDHPNVGASLNSVAENFRVQGKYAEAEPSAKRALVIWEKSLGPEHPLVVRAREHYADLLSKIRDHVEVK